jgi:fructokinase
MTASGCCRAAGRRAAEQYVSGAGLQRDHSSLRARTYGKEIVARAQWRCEGRARCALQDRFARVAANIASVVDPDVFVIGGGLNELPELVEELPPLISRYSFSGTAEAKVVRAKHGEKSGVRGAARLWD